MPFMAVVRLSVSCHTIRKYALIIVMPMAVEVPSRVS